MNSVWTVSSTFAAGEEVTFRAVVADETGAPVEGATVDLLVTGAESAAITSAPSNASGIAEAVWRTSKPKGKGGGGTAPGSYTATTTGLNADGYDWDGIATSIVFTIQ